MFCNGFKLSLLCPVAHYFKCLGGVARSKGKRSFRFAHLQESQFLHKQLHIQLSLVQALEGQQDAASKPGQPASRSKLLPLSGQANKSMI